LPWNGWSRRRANSWRRRKPRRHRVRAGRAPRAAPDQYQEILRFFLLDALDRNWKDHLLQMDYLKEGIGLRGYAQRDPKQEYKREGFELFEDLIFRIRENTMKALTHLRIEAVKQEELKHEEQEDVKYVGGSEPSTRSRTRCAASTPKSAATTPAPAAAVRNTRSAAANWPDQLRKARYQPGFFLGLSLLPIQGQGSGSKKWRRPGN
jgi:preprotein translocase subunit SecA